MAARRFLVLLPDEDYYADMAESIRDGLVGCGAEAFWFVIPTPTQLAKLDQAKFLATLQSFQPTDTIAVNTEKAALPLPSDVRHHCWVQDPHDAKVENGVAGDTWMWVRHWVDWWGGRWLPPATGYGRYHRPDLRPAYDIGFAGVLPTKDFHIPDNPPMADTLRRVARAILDEMERRGHFFCDRNYAETLLAWAESDTGVHLPSPPVRTLMLHHIRARLYRYAQRIRLVNALLPLCERRGWTLRFAGGRWNLEPRTRPYYAGVHKAGAQLAGFYQSVKVNLHCNGDSNFHSRVLECLASGSFVLSEAHETDDRPGGLRSILDEHAAPTYAGLDELEEKLSYYLDDDDARRDAVEQGGAVVRSEHNYVVRMRTVIDA